MKAIKVNLISESTFTVQGHGVHTAFTEMEDSLRARPDIRLLINSLQAADITHIHTVGLLSLFVLFFGRGKKVVSAHVLPDSFKGSLVGARYWQGLAKRYLCWFYNRADAVLAVSQEVAEELKKMGVSSKIHVVNNAINTKKYRQLKFRNKIRKDLGIDSSQFVVIGAGQVQPRKRIDSFIAVAKQLPDVKFIWAGGIPFKMVAANYREMKETMRSAPSNVMFTGEISHADMPNYYAAADLFWLPSEQETFGIVIVEAAASGLPILLRDLNQYKQTFGANYLAGNDGTFAKLIRQVKDDGELRTLYIGRAAKIASQYDSEQVTEQLVKIYRDLLN